MKKIIGFTLCCFPFLLSAQIRHELKTNLQALFNHQYLLEYELIPGKGRWGFEAGVVYSGETVYLDPNSIFDPPAELSYPAGYLALKTGGRYYLNDKLPGIGFYLGGLFNLERWFSHDPEFKALFERKYRSVYYKMQYPLRRVDIGLQGGLKFFLWKKLVVEPNISFHFNLIEPFKYFSYFNDINLIPESDPEIRFYYNTFIKIGYRFNQKRESP